MPSYTLCLNTDCPLRSNCKRSSDDTDNEYQEYALFRPLEHSKSKSSVDSQGNVTMTFIPAGECELRIPVTK